MNGQTTIAIEVRNCRVKMRTESSTRTWHTTEMWESKTFFVLRVFPSQPRSGLTTAPAKLETIDKIKRFNNWFNVNCINILFGVRQVNKSSIRSIIHIWATWNLAFGTRELDVAVKSCVHMQTCVSLSVLVYLWCFVCGLGELKIGNSRHRNQTIEKYKCNQERIK